MELGKTNTWNPIFRWVYLKRWEGPKRPCRSNGNGIFKGAVRPALASSSIKWKYGSYFFGEIISLTPLPETELLVQEGSQRFPSRMAWFTDSLMKLKADGGLWAAVAKRTSQHISLTESSDPCQTMHLKTRHFIFYRLLDCCRWPVYFAIWKTTDWQIKGAPL